MKHLFAKIQKQYIYSIAVDIYITVFILFEKTKQYLLVVILFGSNAAL